VDDIRGYKDNMRAAKKTQIKFCVMCLEIILNCQHSQNIKRLKNNHLETQINAQNNK
jgi:glycerol-3-phosphate acyltransferase PlsY